MDNPFSHHQQEWFDFHYIMQNLSHYIVQTVSLGGIRETEGRDNFCSNCLLWKFWRTGQIDIMVSYWNIMDPLYNAKSIFRYFPGPVLSKFWLKLFLLYNTCFLPWCQNFLEYNGQHTGNESAFRMLGIKHFNVINSNLNHEQFAVK